MDRQAGVSYLNSLAQVMELLGHPPEEIAAYHRGIESVENCSTSEWSLLLAGEMNTADLFPEKIRLSLINLQRNKSASELDSLMLQIPPGLFGLLLLPSLSPALVRCLWREGNIISIKQLERACKRERVMGLTGFDRPLQNRLHLEIIQNRRRRNRWLRREALAFAEQREAELGETRGLLKIKRVGELRRCLEAVTEISWVIAGDDPRLVMGRIGTLAGATLPDSAGADEIVFEISDRPRERMIIVSEAEFASRVFLETGSETHIQAVLSELGQRGSTIDLPETEADIYRLADLPVLEPELREGRGEVDSARNNFLPKLITGDDIKGVLHVHTNWSDGKSSVHQMAVAVAKLGWQYIGITDHSEAAFYAHGLNPERIIEQKYAIERVREALPELRIFHGIECDILPDGQLDLPDPVLASLDFVLISIHTVLQMDREAMTRRIIKGLRNPHSTILAHPSGRLILERESYPVDWDAVFDAAAETGTSIEFNARSERLDLDWRLIRSATDRGVKICISPDAHMETSLSCVFDGLPTARKGWLTAEQVINTDNAEQLTAWFTNRGSADF